MRAATGADVPALHRLIESAYRGDAARAGWTHEADLLGGQRIDIDALTAMLADSQHALLVAEAAGALLGCVALTWLAGERAYIGLMTVAPTGQGAGLGRQLLAAAEDAAREHGCTSTEMTVIVQRAELIAWYERRGYVQTAERRPFPLDDERFGLPKRRDLEFMVLEKAL